MINISKKIGTTVVVMLLATTSTQASTQMGSNTLIEIDKITSTIEQEISDLLSQNAKIDKEFINNLNIKASKEVVKTKKVVVSKGVAKSKEVVKPKEVVVSKDIPARSIEEKPSTIKVIAILSQKTKQQLSQAKKLISKKMYLDAYNLLKKSEFENVQSTAFNYQLGVASLRAGKYTDALYALDRVVSEDPNNIGAQLDMAIAYYYLGNLSFAKQELVKILKNYDKVAPKVVKRTIRAYLKKIKKEQAPKELSIVASISTGYSDNINSGYDGNSVYIPLINANTILSDQSKATPAPFINAQILVNKKKIINRDDSIDATMILNKKIYKDYSSLGQANAILSLSGSHKFNKHTIKLNKTAVRSYLNSKINYDIMSTTATILTQPNQSQSLSAAIKTERMTFANPASQANNSKKESLTLTASDSIFDKKVGVTMGIGLSRNMMDDTAASNGNSKSSDLNLSFKKQILGTLATVSLGYKRNNYDKLNAAFGVYREDRAKSITIGTIKPLDKANSINFSIGYRNQGSNIELYKNDAMTVTMGFKRSF
jgi:tetratricopeptide (TPR) repeat protein